MKLLTVGYEGLSAHSMGQTGMDWSEASATPPNRYFQMEHTLTHNALDDAIAQAKLVERMLGGNL
ncbi:MAG: hypothetical protein HY741_12710 [Chloroflexi bacterium]|nr:hypothetical protein [Chloroflexota bacterium]